MTDKITETAPKRIWLQVCADEYPGDRDDEFPNDAEVTWCAEELGGLEIEYVRADLAIATKAGTLYGTSGIT